ncbi:MAG: recombinase family protein, partial [Oscillospiraceae bacterium]|nr:recombinase family protein [Oscillospiraceae bacterium]
IAYYDAYIAARRHWRFAGRYIDEGLSGTSVKKRESFLRMLDDARAGLFDLLITKEISRFSRNTLDSIRYTQELLSLGVGVFFEADNLCTLTPDAELRLTIMSSIAQDEVRRTAERVKFGFRRSVEQGRVLGADNTLGYRKKDGALTVDEAEAAVVRRVFRQYAQGRDGLRRVARDMERDGVTDARGRMYAYATLRQMLSNPKYKGWYCGHKYTTLDYRTHKVARLEAAEWVTYRDERIPALVSEELWDRANALLADRGARAKTHAAACQSRYPYSGKLFCADHGDAFHRQVYQNKSGPRECWHCRQYRLKGRAEGCDSPTVYSSELDEILARVARLVFDNRNEVVNGLVALYERLRAGRDAAGEADACRRQIDALRRKKDKLLALHLEDCLSKAEFVQRNEAANREIETLDTRLHTLEAERVRDTEGKTRLTDLRRALETEWQNAAQTGLAAALLDRAVVHKQPGGVKLELFLSTGQTWLAEQKKDGISLCEIGISQAQVSRLEKNAFQQIRKNL